VSFSTRVAWTPAYELIISLQAFIASKVHKVIDLGPGWVARVKKNLPADFLAETHALDQDRALLERTFFGTDILVWQGPESRDPEGFMAWLASLSPGEIYERLAPHVPEDADLPRDLGATRDAAVKLFRAWHEGYFRGIDSGILTQLAQEASAREIARVAQAPGAGPEAARFVETTTGGVVFEDLPPGLKEIVLVPQFHFQPLNAIGPFRSSIVVGYSPEIGSLAEGEPSADLLRRTKAVADGSRLRILRFLAQSAAEPARSLTDIAAATRLSASTVLHHLLTLRSAGLVRTHFNPRRPDRYSQRRAGFAEMLARLESYAGAGTTPEDGRPE